jgi:hypothetical protein
MEVEIHDEKSGIFDDDDDDSSSSSSSSSVMYCIWESIVTKLIHL